MSVNNILKGFGSLITGDPLTPEQQERVKICADCTFKTYHKTLTIIDKEFETKEVKGYTCDVCSCYLAAKIRVNDEEYPVGKWTNIPDLG